MEILVIVKEPRAGLVKTRLCPPCTPQDAADLAAAAIADTLDAALSAGVDRVIVAFDGNPGPWLPKGVIVVDQGSGSFDCRLAKAWSHVSGPALQIGMDTPQVTATLLSQACATLDEPDLDAVFGPAVDGGWWAVGMSKPDPGVFLGVATSQPNTGERQHDRLIDAGFNTAILPTLADVDTFDVALTVAREAPHTYFASRMASLVGLRT